MTRRLAMDFQPIFMSRQSLQDYDPSHWERKVRPSIVPKERPSCSICGFIAETNRSLIHADEVWSFPEPPKAVLIDVRALCVYCHEAKDYGEFLSRIRSGEAGNRTETIIAHYCKVNGCTRDEFEADLKVALAAVHEIEERYGLNCDVDVSYGRWSRPDDRPRLSMDARRKLKEVLAALEWWDEPIFIGDMKVSRHYPTAVKQFQLLLVNERERVLAELIEIAETMCEDDEVITERDEGVQWT